MRNYSALYKTIGVVAVPGKNLMEDFVAIRGQRWKLLIPGRKPEGKHRFLTDFGTDDYELYDLRNDPAKTTNLIEEYPKVAERLKLQYRDMYRSFESDYVRLYPQTIVPQVIAI